MSATNVQALVELAGRCEAATGPLWTIDQAIAEAIGWTSHVTEVWTNYDVATTVWTPPAGCDEARWPAYTASLDAAMSLVPEGAGIGWQAGQGAGMDATAGVWCVSTNADDYDANRLPCPIWTAMAHAATPALALTAAALKARAAIEGEG